MTAINKVVYGDRTLIDLTEDTVHPDRMYKGDTAHAADGTEITGTAEITVQNTTLIMPEGLCTLLGTVDPETHHWVRPEGLPNLDDLYDGELNTVYMTVDATGRISDPHVYVRLWAACTVQVGSIVNGEFVAESTDSVANGGYWLKTWTPSAGNYPIVKIMGVSELRGIGFTATTVNGRSYQNRYQAVVEMVGHMNYADGSTITGYFVEREKINITNAAANFLQYRWTNGYCLQEIDTSDWDTTNWAISSLYQTWYYCCNLQYLDVSHWVTTNWTVHSYSMNGTWQYCMALKELDLSDWDTSNWRVNSINATWHTCTSLRKLDVSTWDTSTWVVTALGSTWYRCFVLEDLYLPWNTSNWPVSGNVMDSTWQECWSLRSLDVSSWNTSGWNVKRLTYTWQQCRALKKLDLSNWDTSNWQITSLTEAWRYCHALEQLDVSTWDTSGWAVTSISGTWGNCSNLKSLDLSNWDTSGWAITTMATTWYDDNNLEHLDVSTWDTSNWVVASMESTWNGDRSLNYLPIGNWDTSNWAVTLMTNTWYACAQLETLPISDWDTSNWKVTNFYNPFAWMTSLRELDLSSWDTSGWVFTANVAMTFLRVSPKLVSFDFSFIDLTGKSFKALSSSTYNFDTCYCLQNITFGENNNGKMTMATTTPLRFDWSPLLTHESLMNILNVIGTVSTAKTLQLGSVNLNKLTAEEKAIATNKGWTLA